MTDLRLAFLVYSAGAVAFPWLLCRALNARAVENSSRAIQNDPRRFADRNSIINEGN